MTEYLPALHALTRACERLVSSEFDDFWLVGALGDWSYEEGSRNRKFKAYVESWIPTGLPDCVISALHLGINGHVAALLRQDPIVAAAGAVEHSPSYGPDIVFRAGADQRPSRVQVKHVHDATYPQYYPVVAADRVKACDYQVVFFTALPAYRYPAGRWYGGAKPEPARRTNVVGIPEQLAQVRLMLLGQNPTWPGGGLARIHTLPCCTSAVTEALVRARFAGVLRQDPGDAPWIFDAAMHLRGATVGVAIWDWTGERVVAQ